MRRDLTDLGFAQEVLAQFVTWTGTVFRRITDAVYVEGFSTAQCAIIGVDWGYSNDYTVFTALSQRGEVIELDRFRGVEYNLQRDRLRAMWERQGKRAWIVAELNNMGGPNAEELRRDGLPVVGFTTTGPSKAMIIQQLALAFERGLIKIPNHPALLGELQAFEGTPTPGGGMRYGGPSGVHDDAVMSLAIGWSALVTPRDETRHLDPNSGLYVGQPVEYRISPV
jgi:hypothetical protein